MMNGGLTEVAGRTGRSGGAPGSPAPARPRRTTPCRRGPVQNRPASDGPGQRPYSDGRFGGRLSVRLARSIREVKGLRRRVEGRGVSAPRSPCGRRRRGSIREVSSDARPYAWPRRSPCAPRDAARGGEVGPGPRRVERPGMRPDLCRSLAPCGSPGCGRGWWHSGARGGRPRRRGGRSASPGAWRAFGLDRGHARGHGPGRSSRWRAGR
jgi:hypothetical protein